MPIHRQEHVDAYRAAEQRLDSMDMIARLHKHADRFNRRAQEAARLVAGPGPTGDAYRRALAMDARPVRFRLLADEAVAAADALADAALDLWQPDRWTGLEDGEPVADDATEEDAR